jgi:tetratricopeptide (TPR) repeat protein
MTMLSLSHRRNPCVHFWTLTLTSLIALLTLFAVSNQCLLYAQEPVAIIQERIAKGLDQIKAASDQHLSDAHTGYLWARLAVDYRKAGNFEASESAYLKALPLLEREHPASRNYATTLDNFSMLYLTYGRIDDAERYNKKAAALRENMNYPLDRARSEQHKAEIDLAKHRFKEAESEAADALKVMQSLNDPDQLDLISASNALAFTRCMRGRCEQGMEDARRSLDIARNGFGTESLSYAHALLAVGFASWKLGRSDDANKEMRTAIEIIRSQPGSENRSLVLALAEYRNYLKSVHRNYDADIVAKELTETRNGISLCATCVTVNSLRGSTK